MAGLSLGLLTLVAGVVALGRLLLTLLIVAVLAAVWVIFAESLAALVARLVDAIIGHGGDLARRSTLATEIRALPPPTRREGWSLRRHNSPPLLVPGAVESEQARVEPQHREEAVRNARRACTLGRYQMPEALGILAGAYAEETRFEEAERMAEFAFWVAGSTERPVFTREGDVSFGALPAESTVPSGRLRPGRSCRLGQPGTERSRPGEGASTVWGSQRSARWSRG